MPRNQPVTFDLHVHTSRHSPDSAINPFALLRQAQAVGLSGIVITEHDWLWTEEELEELRAATPQVQVFAGVEVSTKDGHFLAYGVRDPLKTPVGITVDALCREVHLQGGVVVAAHPYRWGQDFDAILKERVPELDGMELMSNNMDESTRGKALEMWKTRTWAGLGNSDGHELEVVGCCFTEFPQPLRDERDLAEAIRSAQTTPRERKREEG